MGLYEKLTAGWYPAAKPIDVVETDDRWVEVVDTDGITINVHKRPAIIE